MFIEIVVEGPVQRHRYQRCWIRRIATGTSLAGLVAHDLQGEADWRCLEIALRRCCSILKTYRAINTSTHAWRFSA